VFGIHNQGTAWEIASGASAPNSGIVQDVWHYMRGDPDDALLSHVPGVYRPET
jgi:4-hydroxyphenylpyruvate dioxygenase